MNSPQSTVVVLMAVFNGMRWLPEQLDSILKQEGVSVTVIVSVDQSSDETQAWIEGRAKFDSRILVLPSGERFGSAARNFFRLLRDVDVSGFEYISFADQDDIWLPNKLLRAQEMLLGFGADAYSSNVTAFWPDGRQALIQKTHPQVQWDFLFESAGPGCTYVMNNTLAIAVQRVVRSKWSEIQNVGFHDWFTYAFARANGFRWVVDEVPGMLYRQHENNEIGANSGWNAFAQRAGRVLSGWGLTQSSLIARLVGLNDDPFVVRWANGGRSGFLFLALHAGQCRRRLRDKFIFAFSCGALSLIELGRQ